ncbi:MAG: MFS transporter [Candidatus Eremiobacteraeota bacterium]|nr:MFS transporter [Candidatus Eremiobacteraeota bacterium]
MSSTRTNLFSLSIFWFAWEVHWGALLGAALQGQIARFAPADAIGTASAILGGAGALFSIASQYGAGFFSDRTGRRMPFIIAGTLCDVAALFAFALAPTFELVLLAFVGVQLSLNAACGPYQALMPDRVELAARGKASAVMGLLRLSGTAGGLLLAKIFVHQPGPGMSSVMFTSGLLHLAEIVSAILVIALGITAAGMGEQPRGSRQRVVAIDMAWPLRSSFGWLIVSRSLVNLGLYSILPFLAFYLRFAQHVNAYIGRSLDLLLVMIACALVGTVPAGVAGDRMPKKSILYWALACLAVGALCLSLVRSAHPLLYIAVLLGLGWGAYYSVDWALACSLLPPGRAGALMAVWNIGASAPQVAAPVIGGLLIDRAGAWAGDLGLGYRVLFGCIALFVVLGAVSLLRVHEPGRIGSANGVTARKRSQLEETEA